MMSVKVWSCNYLHYYPRHLICDVSFIFELFFSLYLSYISLGGSPCRSDISGEETPWLSVMQFRMFSLRVW
jgi:hypothetical protein